MTSDRAALLALAEAVETGGFHSDHPNLTIEVLAVFGIHQARLPKAGYKRWYPESGRWGSMLRPIHDIKDCCEMLQYARALPELIHSDPRKAVAAALRARAASGASS